MTRVRSGMLSADASRRNFLRLGGGLAAASVGAPMLAACASPSDDSAGGDPGQGGGDGTFTFYTSTNHVYDAWKEVIRQFEEDHDITVNWQKYSFPDMQTKLQTDFAAGIVPDLVEYSGGSDSMQFVLTGDVRALDSYIAQDGDAMGFPGDWQDQAVQSWQYDGGTYGIQLMLTTSQVYYNRRLLEQAGISTPPDTWDDLLSAAQEVTNGDVHGISLNATSSFSRPWILQAGAQLYDPTTEQFLSPREAAIEALQFQQDLIHKYKVSPVPAPTSDFTASRDLFTAERAAIIFTGPWDIGPIRKGNPDIDLGIALPLEGAVRSTQFAGAGMFIPERAAEPDLAWDLIKRISALETMLALTDEAGQTMPRKSWAAEPRIADDPLLSSIAASMQYAQDWGATLATTGAFAEVDAAYGTLYQDVVLRAQPPESVFDAFLSAAGQATE